jgi:hypothetical protein
MSLGAPAALGRIPVILTCLSWTGTDTNLGVRADPRSSDSVAWVWPREATEHDADHGEADEGGDGPRVPLVIAHEPPVPADPREGPLDDPSLEQDLEAVQVGALDDLQPPRAGARNRRGHPRPLIAAVRVDARDEREAAAGPAQKIVGAVAVLDVGGVDDDVQQETERVDENVPLAPERLLARVVARRIDRGPPFEAPRAVWLSMTAALELASRPSSSRAPA